MGGQLTYILQQWSFSVDNLRVENEVAAVIVKAAHIPDDAELAGETRQQNVVVRDRVGRNRDIARGLRAEILLVGPLCLRRKQRHA